MDWKEKVLEMKAANYTWVEIGEAIQSTFPRLTIDQLKEKARNYYRRQGKEEEKQSEELRQTIEYKNDGSTTFQGIIKLMDGEQITPEAIMKAHNLDSNKWDVITYKTNFWQAQKKGGSKMLLYQSKITVKPKTTNEITFEMIDKYFDNKDFANIPMKTIASNYSEDGEIIEIDVADLHVGALCYGKEAGVDYDLKIAKEYYFTAMNDIVERCKNRKIKKIVLITLGDFIHIDNDMNTTAHGTRQDCDSRISKIVEVAEDMLIDSITMLGNIATVEYIYIRGNHDATSGYILARSVKNAFRNDQNITFDVSPNPIKHRLWGKNLVMWHHGDMPKGNLDDLVQKHAREDFGKSKRAELHTAHLHDLITRTKCATVIRTMPTLCESTSWEHQQGYKSPVKEITTFVWNEEKGLREEWHSSL